MPIVYANAEERRRGGWLTRAEGRVKTKGLPVGPRSPELRRILEGPDADLLLKAPDDAIDPRCAQLAVKIGNEVATLRNLSDKVNARNEQEIELSGDIEALWQEIEADILRSTFATLVRFLRVRRLLDKLIDALKGGAKDAEGIIFDVNRAFALEKEQKRVIREKKRFLGLLAEQQRKLRRLLDQSDNLGCDTPSVGLIA